MSQSIGGLQVNLALESANFVSGLRKASAETERASTAINTALGRAGTAVKGFIALMTVDAFVSASKRAFDYADAIVDLSDRTGASTKTIQEFGYAAQLTGSSVDSSRTALEKFTKKVGDAQAGSKSAQAELAKYGVNAYNLDTALTQAADGISKLDSKQKQNAATTALFGKKAGDLTTLMSGGSEAIEEFARKAEELGIVLGDDVLRNAGQVNDQLDTTKMILDAKFAGMIVKNADALVSFADGIMKVSSALLEFWQQQPELAMGLMGAAGGAMIGGGPGAAIGGVAGAVGGYMMRGSAEDGNTDLRFRTDQVYAAKKKVQAARAGSTGIQGIASVRYDLGEALADLERQTALLNNAKRIKKGGTTNPLAGDLRTFAAGGSVKPTTKKSGSGRSGKSADEQAREAFEDDLDWQNELSRAKDELLGTQKDLSTIAFDRFAFEREKLDEEFNSRGRNLDASGPLGSQRYDQAELDALKGYEAQIRANRADLINREENELVRAQALQLGQAGLQTDADLLSIQSGAVRTAAERRDIELRLVDLQYEQEKLALKAIIASKQSTEAEQQIATARLGMLDTLRTGARTNVIQGNLGPLGSYLDAIPRTGAEINESLEGVAVEGLESLKTGLKDVIKGTGDLGSAFANMTDSIIDGLLEIALKQMIIKPLGSMLFGSGETGDGTGILGAFFKSFAGSLTGTPTLGGKSNGGLGNKGRWLVGEHGPEEIEVGGPFNVIPNSKLKGIRRDGSSGVTVNFGSIVSNDPAAVKAMAMEAVAQMTPMIVNQAAKTTMGNLQRPRM